MGIKPIVRKTKIISRSQLGKVTKTKTKSGLTRYDSEYAQRQRATRKKSRSKKATPRAQEILQEVAPQEAVRVEVIREAPKQVIEVKERTAAAPPIRRQVVLQPTKEKKDTRFSELVKTSPLAFQPLMGDKPPIIQPRVERGDFIARGAEKVGREIVMPMTSKYFEALGRITGKTREEEELVTEFSKASFKLATLPIRRPDIITESLRQEPVPKTLVGKAALFGGGAFYGVVEELRYKPVKTSLELGAGAVVGGSSRLFVSKASKVVGGAILAGGVGLWGYGTGKEFMKEESIAGKGAVVGVAGKELTVFSAGYGLTAARVPRPSRPGKVQRPPKPGKVQKPPTPPKQRTNIFSSIVDKFRPFKQKQYTDIQSKTMPGGKKIFTAKIATGERVIISRAKVSEVLRGRFAEPPSQRFWPRGKRGQVQFTRPPIEPRPRSVFEKVSKRPGARDIILRPTRSVIEYTPRVRPLELVPKTSELDIYRQRPQPSRPPAIRRPTELEPSRPSRPPAIRPPTDIIPIEPRPVVPRMPTDIIPIDDVLPPTIRPPRELDIYTRPTEPRIEPRPRPRPTERLSFPGAPVIPWFPTLDAGGGGLLGSYPRRTRKIRFTKYTPSISAVTFNIRGIVPRGTLSGLEQRPLAPLSKKKKKKKKKRS